MGWGDSLDGGGLAAGSRSGAWTSTSRCSATDEKSGREGSQGGWGSRMTQSPAESSSLTGLQGDL